MSKPTCKIDGCDRLHYAKGFCHNHYNQWWGKQNPERAREADRKYRLANPEKVQEVMRNWRRGNPEYNRKYRQANLEKERKRVREWDSANPEKKREAQRRWRQANSEKVRALNAKRRALKANTIDNLAAHQLSTILARGCFFGTVGNCEGPLSIAHDVALSEGGNTTVGNVFCLCRSHNSQMRTRSLDEMLIQLELL